MKAGGEAEKSVWEAMVSTNESYKRTMTHNGIKVIKPSSELREGFIKIGDTLASEWVEVAGDRGKRILADFDP
jgi:TRAP-type C4-dicarboxylate transport system substrate-binding protein